MGRISCLDLQRASASDGKGFIIPQRAEFALASLCFTGSSCLCFFEDGCDVCPVPATKTFQTLEICSSLSHISYILCSSMDSFFKHVLIDVLVTCIVLHYPRLWYQGSGAGKPENRPWQKRSYERKHAPDLFLCLLSLAPPPIEQQACTFHSLP